MAKWTIRGVFGGLLIPVFSLVVLAQGLSFDIVRGESAAVREKELYMPGKFRSEGKDGHIGILRLDKEVMISINPEKKTYTETTFKEFESGLKQGLSTANEMMKKRLAALPPEQRKKLEERMAATTGSHADSKTEAINTGTQKTIDGYRCTGYTLKRAGKEIETVWATKDVPNFESVRRDFQRAASVFNSMTGGRHPLALLEQIDGFPIERTGKSGVEEKMTKIQSGSFPPSAFEVPPGYTKEKSRFGENE